jgi:hypothetical protein
MNTHRCNRRLSIRVEQETQQLLDELRAAGYVAEIFIPGDDQARYDIVFRPDDLDGDDGNLLLPVGV